MQNSEERVRNDLLLFIQNKIMFDNKLMVNYLNHYIERIF